MRTSYDVTIVGAGLAGLQCARLLAQQGISVLLVDRKHTLDQKIHTTGIFVRRTLVDFDLPEDCLGPPIRHVTLYSPAHRSLELVSDHDEFRIGRMGQLYQRYLQQCLHSGVAWLPQTSYLGHSATHGKVTLRLSSGSITTRYLIGADGARSRVARDLKLELNREWIVGMESSVCVCAPSPSTPRPSRVAVNGAVKFPSEPPPAKVSARSKPISAASARACSYNAAPALLFSYGGRFSSPVTLKLTPSVFDFRFRIFATNSSASAVVITRRSTSA